MRVLGIETSAQRGSVALVAQGKLVASAHHEQPNAHAEELLPLLQRLLADAGWSRQSLDRIGVGIGPGSFTGLRVGIALAEGLALGLGRPVLGVGSLRAMTRGVPLDYPGVRCALVDARRSELFAAAYDQDGREKVQPCAVPRDKLRALLETLDKPVVVVGSVATELGLNLKQYSNFEVDLPHAHWIAVLASELDPNTSPAEPIYVRGPGATLPDLPPSPLEPAS